MNVPTPPDGPPLGEAFTWSHVIVTVYGAWLDGDLRGFRTRHHREHVEGDYKAPPPPERYAERRRRSEESLKNPPVSLPPAWRSVIGGALVDRFRQLKGFVLVAAMGRQHGHLLVKLPRGTARQWTGLAKKHAWFVARDAGWLGKLWGIRSRAINVADRKHQLNVYYYILGHEKEGAWVWRWRSPSPGGAPPGTFPPGGATPGLA
ncbi:MAG TPA: hypothetical protein VFW33_14085 [Gemmataceae bacterium]|nr:hypothetical protein [Gemmataceae bacterium]